MIGQLAITTIQRIGQGLTGAANSTAYWRASYTLYRAINIAEQGLVYAEFAGLTVGTVGLVASGMDSMAENLLRNTQPIGDGPFPESVQRGSFMEGIAKPNLGGNVNIIDDLDENGTGTSLRTHSLKGGSEAYLQTIEADAKEVSKAPNSRIFGTTTDGRVINRPPGTVKQTALLVAVPQNEAPMLVTPRFRQALQAYRNMYGVVIRVIPVIGFLRK